MIYAQTSEFELELVRILQHSRLLNRFANRLTQGRLDIKLIYARFDALRNERDVSLGLLLLNSNALLNGQLRKEVFLVGFVSFAVVGGKVVLLLVCFGRSYLEFGCH
jgi:hypothetical protein